MVRNLDRRDELPALDRQVLRAGDEGTDDRRPWLDGQGDRLGVYVGVFEGAVQPRVRDDRLAGGGLLQRRRDRPQRRRRGAGGDIGAGRLDVNLGERLGGGLRGRSGLSG